MPGEKETEQVGFSVQVLSPCTKLKSLTVIAASFDCPAELLALPKTIEHITWHSFHRSDYFPRAEGCENPAFILALPKLRAKFPRLKTLPHFSIMQPFEDMSFICPVIANNLRSWPSLENWRFDFMQDEMLGLPRLLSENPGSFTGTIIMNIWHCGYETAEALQVTADEIESSCAESGFKAELNVINTEM